MSLSKEMYTDMILEYYNNPNNKGSLENPDFKFKDVNPSCGDIIEIQGKIINNNLKEIKFNGNGCAISQASAELLTEFVKNKDIKEISKLNKENVLELLGIDLSPVRLKCALLSLKVLKYGLYSHLGKELESGEQYE